MSTIGITDMRGTRGYLQKFNKRNNIALRAKHGEAPSVSRGTIDQWKPKLQLLIKVCN